MLGDRRLSEPHQPVTSWPSRPAEYDDSLANQEYGYKQTRLPQYYRNNDRSYSKQRQRNPYNGKQLFPGNYGDYSNTGLLYHDNTDDFDYGDSFYGTLPDANREYSDHVAQHERNNKILDDDDGGDDDDDDGHDHHHGEVHEDEDKNDGEFSI